MSDVQERIPPEQASELAELDSAFFSAGMAAHAIFRAARSAINLIRGDE